jgi:hypothetical protein
MANTLLQFSQKYFEYDGDKAVLVKGLTIRGYESAWLANLVAASVMEKTAKLFHGTAHYKMYCDDCLVIFHWHLLQGRNCLLAH